MTSRVRARNRALLESALPLLEELSEEQYAGSAGEPGLEGAGAHFRHALEFYVCFFEGFEQRHVDYDARRREAELQTNPACARERVAWVIDRLTEVADVPADTSVEVRQDDVDRGEAAPEWSRSSLRRELQFLAAHLVHHYALIAVILRRLGVQVPGDFGVAPSTLAHWKESGARAS